MEQSDLPTHTLIKPPVGKKYGYYAVDGTFVYDRCFVVGTFASVLFLFCVCYHFLQIGYANSGPMICTKNNTSYSVDETYNNIDIKSWMLITGIFGVLYKTILTPLWYYVYVIKNYSGISILIGSIYLLCVLTMSFSDTLGSTILLANRIKCVLLFSDATMEINSDIYNVASMTQSFDIVFDILIGVNILQWLVPRIIGQDRHK